MQLLVSWLKPPNMPQSSCLLREYINRILQRISLNTALKTKLQMELGFHLACLKDKYIKEGHSPDDAISNAKKRFGKPEVIADQYNQLEATRSFLRDPVCVKAMVSVLLGYTVLVVIVESLTLSAGLFGNIESMKDFGTASSIIRVIMASLSGIIAYKISLNTRGNKYRLKPYIWLSVCLFFFALFTRCEFYIVEPFPEPKLHAFYIMDFPYIFSHGPHLFWNGFIIDIDFSDMPYNLNYPYNTLRIINTPFEKSDITQILLQSIPFTIAMTFFLYQLRKICFWQNRLQQ